MSVFENICAMADSMEQELIASRRDFHQYAELCWQEMRTTSLVARKLSDLGYELVMGKDLMDKDARLGVPSEEVLEEAYARAEKQGADPQFLPYTKGGMTGVMGILRCGEGPVVAMRFDIDALPIVETTDAGHFPADQGFISKNGGVMHACGHDGHTAIGLGVAEIIAKIKNKLHGTVKLIFQPAEEGVRGAKPIVDKGHLDDVDFLLGSHIDKPFENEPDATLIAGSYGALATCKYDIYYHGKAAHAGALPHLGNNALLAAAAATLNLHAISRHGEGASRVNVGKFHAGTGLNVIAEEAYMGLEVRGDTTKINEYMIEQAEKILDHCADMYGCTCEKIVVGMAEGLDSDLDFAEDVRKVCREQMGMAVSDTLTAVSFGSEDFSFMMNRVQKNGGKATFMRVLAPMKGVAHNDHFDFGESCLKNGVKAFSAMAAALMK